MRFVSSLVLSMGFLTAIGCGGGKTKEYTPEELAQQREAAKQVQAAESERQKTLPKEKTQSQTVNEQERARKR